MPKKPLVVNRKLQRERAKGEAFVFGMADPDGIIEVDPRQGPKERMDTLIHESLHLSFPDAKERDIVGASRCAAHVLWRDGYRRVEK